MGRHLSLQKKKQIALDIVTNNDKYHNYEKIAQKNKVDFTTVKKIEKTIDSNTKIETLRKDGIEDYRKIDDLKLQQWIVKKRKDIAKKFLKASNLYLSHAIKKPIVEKESGYRSILSSKIATDGALLALGQQASNAPQVKIYLPSSEKSDDWKVVTIEENPT